MFSKEDRILTKVLRVEEDMVLISNYRNSGNDVCKFCVLIS